MHRRKRHCVCGFAVTLLLSLCTGVFADAAEIAALTGRLILNTSKPLDLEVLRDDYGFSSTQDNRLNFLPHFDFEYIQEGEHLIPARRGLITGNHPLRDYILEPGHLKADPIISGVSQASLPFTLQERNANCMHNGVLKFTVLDDGSLSNAEITVASETCMYFKYNLHGTLDARFVASEVADAENIRAQFYQHRSARLLTADFEALAEQFPEVSLAAFSGNGKLPREDITVYGFVLDDVHYLSNCNTRRSTYAHCEEMSLPSYSLAKSILAGIAAMRLEKLFPGTRDANIAAYVPACRATDKWSDVTFDQTLNMLTGNYGTSRGREDEASKQTEENFFFKSSHDDKIGFSCDAWPRRAKPGTQWVYHTTDTYILGTAMNALLRENLGADADLYDDLLSPLWRDMSLGPATATPLRSADDSGQVFTGFGMTLLPDDIARLAVSLNRGSFADQLDDEMFRSAMQKRKKPQGVFPVDDIYYYRHGFWGFDAQSVLSCEEPLIIPFMSGYGGINVVMMPNDTIYYIFNDGGEFAFADAVRESHLIRPMCPPTNTKESTT